MKKAAIVYDEKTDETMLRKAAEIAKGAGYEVKKCSASSLDEKKLKGVGIVLHCTGSQYKEGSELYLRDYVRAGNTLVTLGGCPFADPSGDAGQADMHKGIRAFGIADTFHEVELPETCFLRIERENWNPYGKVQGEQESAYPLRAYAGLYHLSGQTADGSMEKSADLLPVAGFYDKEGHMLAAPIVQISYRQGGSLYFFAWDEKKKNILENTWAQELLEEICGVSGKGFLSYDAEMSYARYNPGEKVCLHLEHIAVSGRRKVNFLIEVSKKGETGPVYRREILTGAERYRLALPVTDGGEYEVSICGSVEGVCLLKKKTGFYIMDTAQIQKEMQGYARMQVKPESSVDFCIREGKPVCMHGTTYFVTDVYQKCFMHFNLAKCEEDLALLEKDGFNILRSGNWMLNVEFYGKDGHICEQARRALQAYFYCAMKHGFTVQFTLGIITLNDWDRSQCAVHNPHNMKKVLRLVTAFSELFGSYTNVMLDILNEPSYSFAGQWKTCRPSGDPYERKAWVKWLRQKYGTMKALRQAWGENAASLPDFASVDVPKERCYQGGLYRTEEDREYAMAADFWLFAQESYNGWLQRLRDCIRHNAPDMVVMMGRDESLRVPEEQDMLLSGNLDMVCWHQWHSDAAIYVEYLLNRVKGHITCAQELGIYRVERMRGGKTLTDERVAQKLERKLMFGFGNWIIWQSFHNPEKEELSENMLGTYRSDRGETPAMPLIRQMIQAENKALPYMAKRQEEAFPILTIYATSSHYSIYNSQSVESLRNHIFLLNNCLRMQSDVIPEHLFCEKNKEAIGRPALIMLPGVMRLTDSCIAALKAYMEQGGCVLVSGSINENEYFAKKDRLTEMGLVSDKDSYSVRNVMNFEKIDIGGELYTADFRRGCNYGDAENYLTSGVSSAVYRDGVYRVRVALVGKGKMIYCPLPLELAEDREAALALYRIALKEAAVRQEVYETDPGKENIFVHAIVYQDCTSYTLINEGASEQIQIRDRRSDTLFHVTVPTGRSCRFWVGTDGSLKAEYAVQGCAIKKGV